ncbi:MULTISPECIES: hypothetical protein [unclassified Pseudomonas]|nr:MULTISPECIES: hypothetical protein [unclassified Pseudomonas]
MRNVENVQANPQSTTLAIHQLSAPGTQMVGQMLDRHPPAS